ncbi:MAG: hypothetical protein IT459_23505 [Planctomycetes bacterium]|nr:hypothetical protein [Planctomycetota bacterium]
MRRLRHAWSALALPIALAACGEDPHPSGDPNCNDFYDEPPPPIAMLVYIGMFSQEPFGEPLCLTDASITIVQGSRVSTLARRVRDQARLLEDGVHMVEVERNWACNLYEDDNVRRICDPPLEYSVVVEGCDPVEGVFTWGDNYLGSGERGGLDLHWHLPIMLNCTDPPIDGTVDGGPFPCEGCVPDGGL